MGGAYKDYHNRNSVMNAGRYICDQYYLSDLFNYPKSYISIQQSTEFWHNDFGNELSVHNQADAVLNLSKVQLSELDEVDR
jgi:hypothetical protein